MTTAANMVLFDIGQTSVPFFVITKGQVEIARPAGPIDTVVTTHGPGEFTGEANMLSGRRALVRGRVTGHPVIASAEPGERWLFGYPDDAFAEY